MADLETHELHPARTYRKEIQFPGDLLPPALRDPKQVQSTLDAHCSTVGLRPLTDQLPSLRSAIVRDLTWLIHGDTLTSPWVPDLITVEVLSVERLRMLEEHLAAGSNFGDGLKQIAVPPQPGRDLTRLSYYVNNLEPPDDIYHHTRSRDRVAALVADSRRPQWEIHLIPATEQGLNWSVKGYCHDCQRPFCRALQKFVSGRGCPSCSHKHAQRQDRWTKGRVDEALRSQGYKAEIIRNGSQDLSFPSDLVVVRNAAVLVCPHGQHANLTELWPVIRPDKPSAVRFPGCFVCTPPPGERAVRKDREALLAAMDAVAKEFPNLVVAPVGLDGQLRTLSCSLHPQWAASRGRRPTLRNLAMRRRHPCPGCRWMSKLPKSVQDLDDVSTFVRMRGDRAVIGVRGVCTRTSQHVSGRPEVVEQPDIVQVGRASTLCRACRHRTGRMMSQIGAISAEVEPLQVPVSWEEPIWWQHSCGFQYQKRPQQVLRKYRGCQRCQPNGQLTEDEQRGRCLETTDGRAVLVKANGWSHRSTFRCSVHAEEFHATPFHLSSTSGCRVCRLEAGSGPERACARLLRSAVPKMQIESQYSHKDLVGVKGGRLRFDFALHADRARLRDLPAALVEVSVGPHHGVGAVWPAHWTVPEGETGESILEIFRRSDDQKRQWARDRGIPLVGLTQRPWEQCMKEELTAALEQLELVHPG